MKYNRIVDCHMHTLTKEEFNLYMKTACADKYINIRGLYIDEMFDPYNFENTGWTIYWIGMAIIVGTTVLMWWQSWRNYKNAQITNKLNRI